MTNEPAFFLALFAMAVAFAILNVLVHGLSRMSEPVDFYMVWTKTGYVPRRTHDDFASAEREAERLAQLHPGKKFIVLKAVAKYGVPASHPHGETL